LAHGSLHVASAVKKALRGETRPTRAEWMEWLTPPGSMEYAQAAARQYVFEALAALELLPPSDAKSSLSALAEFILQRRR